MDITYRQAREADLDPATQIVAAAINDLRVRHGLVADVVARPSVFQRHCLGIDPDGFWVAEQNGALVGYSFAWVSQDFWFLSQLFIQPDAQSSGIGQALFTKALAPGKRHRVRNHALITFAYNRASTGLYIRNGLYPRQPLYAVQAPAEKVRAGLGLTKYETASLPADTPTWIGDLDARVLGFRRDSHHAFQARNPAVHGVGILHAGTPVGYAYIAGGHIGPMAIDPSADASQAIIAVLGAALSGNPAELDLMVPGAAEATQSELSRLGFRITEPMVLLSAKPFGDWRCYLPNNPGYM